MTIDDLFSLFMSALRGWQVTHYIVVAASLAIGRGPPTTGSPDVSRREPRERPDIRRRPEVSAVVCGFSAESRRQSVEVSQWLQRDAKLPGHGSQAAHGVRKPRISREVAAATGDELPEQFRLAQARLQEGMPQLGGHVYADSRGCERSTDGLDHLA